MTDFITPREAATRMGCSLSLLQKRCKAGRIPSVRVGKDYRVLWTDIEDWMRSNSSNSQTPLNVSDTGDLLPLIESWVAYLTHVRAFSPRSVELYESTMRCYLRRVSTLHQKKLSIQLLFDRQTVLGVFSKIPAKSYSTKMNTYLAIRSFGTFLISEGKLTQGSLEELKILKPRRQVEPRRTHLKPELVSRLFDVILSRRGLASDNLTFAAMVACIDLNPEIRVA